LLFCTGSSNSGIRAHLLCNIPLTIVHLKI